MTERAFATNVPDLIQRLGHSLYNDPFIAVRELVQNANDACLLADGLHGTGKGRIDLEIDRNSGTLTVTDTGIGMTEKDLNEFLSTIASSNKTNLRRQLENSKFLHARGIAGKFGIGFLSTFLVAEKVSIKTRHLKESGEALCGTRRAMASTTSLPAKGH